jgi:hypothetical protein
MRRLLAATALLGLGCSGGGGPGVATSSLICDGTPALKLRLYVEPENMRELRGSIVRVENGFPSFMLDGACNYWMSGDWNDSAEPLARDLGWRTGHVDADLQRQLEQTLPLEHLDELADCQSTVGLFDASALTISSATSHATCVRGGPRFERAWSLVEARGADLWSQGAPLDGGIRVEAVAFSSGDSSQAYPWPASQPLGALMLPDDVAPQDDKQFTSGVSTLISDPATAAQLRQLRDQYIADRHATPGFFFDGQKMDDHGTQATVYMRDQLPYEDAQGLLRFPDQAL